MDAAELQLRIKRLGQVHLHHCTPVRTVAAHRPGRPGPSGEQVKQLPEVLGSTADGHGKP